MDCRTRRGVVVALAAILLVAPACNSASAGGNTLVRRQPDSPIVRRAFRPILEPERVSRVYPSGYAGAAYAPLFGPPPAYPSTYKQGTGLGHWAVFPHPLRHHWYDPAKP
jgi:hypothetical protein